VNPAARVALARLVAEGSLERVPVDATVCQHLLTQSGNHLRTAAGGAEDGDPERAFQLAYDACRKTCLALVLGTGLRPRGDRAHGATFEAAATIAQRFGARNIVDDAADLRFVRHGAEYRAETVSAADALDAISIGHELLNSITPRVRQILAAT